MNQSLDEIFQKKHRQASVGAAINWDERREKYISVVDSLYQTIEKFLAEPIAHKTAVLQRRPKELSENYIGTYKVDDLILLVGDEQVRFSPRGRNIVGASGRVDVLGERGDDVLIVQIDSRWSFVQTRQPTLKVVPFDESSFAELLKRVMRD